MLQVKKNELIAAIEKLLDKTNITVKRSKIVNLADKLVKKVSKGGKISEYIKISQVEEFSLGFSSDEVKVFAFGLGPKAVFAFKSNSQDEEDKESEESVNSGQDHS